jgi:hypothetical protein
VISNPTSGRNARHGLLAAIDDVLSAHPAVAHQKASSYAGIAAATRALAGCDADVIALNGGDGTVQAALSALLAMPLASLPVLAVLPGGTTNTTARNVGYGARPLPALEGLLTASAAGRLAGRVEAHAVVRADFDGGPQYGMMFGAGGVYSGIKFAREQLASRGMRGQTGAALALATFLVRALTGEGGTLFPPLAVDVEVDGTPLASIEYFGMLISTIDRQFLGVTPYWGDGPGRLRFSSLRYRPAHLGRAVVPALRGRPSRWLQPEFGYRSVNAERVDLRFTGGFTLDGELFAPAEGERRVTLTARQSAYFLRSDASRRPSRRNRKGGA